MCICARYVVYAWTRAGVISRIEMNNNCDDYTMTTMTMMDEWMNEGCLALA